MSHQYREIDRTCDVAIVGGGTAGLTAALAAVKGGGRVIIYEKMARPGLRLMASGGGRCNLSNTLDAESFMARFGRRGRFIQPALAALDSKALRQMLKRLGVPTFSPDGLHVYPVSESGADVQRALMQASIRSGVCIHVDCAVTALVLRGRRLAGLETTRGVIRCPRVIVATGGLSYVPLGGGESGYELARQAGHVIAPPRPALVPLITREKWPASCAGATLPEVELRLAPKGTHTVTTRGALLFTHRGLSGPAALDLSGAVSDRLQDGGPVPAFLNLSPGLRPVDWIKRLDEWPQAGGRRMVLKWLDGFLPRSVAEALIGVAGLPRDLTAARLSRTQRKALGDHLAAWPLTLTGTEGFEHAMVTRGGVRLEEINPRTLESRRVSGLYFAGEVVDLDGPCGGFNLQWAFSSGHLAGLAAAGDKL
ncbi:MAG: NAD(P)/FAD-dependent oxidoreductase [Verrucomicrobia bacterium]|nr:NAD(P)/FAD-dependent oxidoreductase [Verrucomicrobiota bacterium]MBU1909588.1 NAD(P)/FAD-dependent oxidoreductase [Verrucomicrobiota bacterium]